MAFTVNPSLTHVPVDENLLHEVYRSVDPVAVASTGGRPCDAFICTSRLKNQYEVYVALLDTITKKVHVFTSDLAETTPADYPGMLTEATRFVTDLGFSLQKMNIDFSPGIRQVVIRDIRVMHPPVQRTRGRVFRGEQKQEKPEKKPAENSPVPAAADVVVATVVAAVASVENAVPAGTAAVGAAALGAALSVNEEAETAHLREELAAARSKAEEVKKKSAALTAELAAAREERDKGEAELRELREAFARQSLAATRLKEELGKMCEAQAAREASFKAQVAAAEEKMREALKEAARSKERGGREKEMLPDAVAELEGVLVIRETEILQLEKKLTEARQVVAHLEKRIDSESEASAAAVADAERRAAADCQRLQEEVLTLQAKIGEREAALTEVEEMLENTRRVAEGKDEEIIHLSEEKKRSRERHVAQLAELRKEVAHLRSELEDARARHEEESARLAEEGREARREATRLTEHLQLLERVAADAQSTAEESARSSKEVEVTHEEEIRQLTAASAFREAAYAKTVAELQAQVEEQAARLIESEETLAHLQKDFSRLTVERPTLLAAARKAKRMQEELKRLAAEHAAREAALLAELAELRDGAVSAALPGPVASAPTPERSQEIRQEVVREEAHEGVRQAVCQDVPESREALQKASPLELPGEMPSWSDALSALLAEGEGFAPADFGKAGVDFLIDPTVHRVDVASADDIVALYESMNTVQAMPDGRGLKRCGAYICVVRREDGNRIFNVWSLVDEGRTLIAVPSQLENSNNRQDILKDALFYFESVGFIMEPIDVSSTRHKVKGMARVPGIHMEREQDTGKEVPVASKRGPRGHHPRMVK